MISLSAITIAASINCINSHNLYEVYIFNYILVKIHCKRKKATKYKKAICIVSKKEKKLLHSRKYPFEKALNSHSNSKCMVTQL